ncbi:hypothetical protein [Streptomyces graminilatus]|uniref:hypothetical protein n=1 Tax=Streptomyces graminilatus TaxID=1464070 RepID=UPI0006E37A6D|nr:hypothetical protein [Streptomyces graminilatus]
MTKLPDNPALLKLYRNGKSDKEIAAMFDVSFQAVNKRLREMGIWRAPFKAQAQDILEHVWPKAETQRTKFMRLNRARDLFYFLRRRLGDKALTELEMRGSERFEALIREGDVVLALMPNAPEGPWVLEPRLDSDGRMVIRWPEGRPPLADEKHRAALDLPLKPWGES